MAKCAGILFCTPDDRVLLLKRSKGSDHPREFDLPGGHIEPGETPEQAAIRETQEEAGFTCDSILHRLYHSDDGKVEYTTFLARVSEFTPKLNDEHTAFIWHSLDDLPNTLHPGLNAVLHSDAVLEAIQGDQIYADATWAEEDHPRAENGQFGNGGGKSLPKSEMGASLVNESPSEFTAERGKFNWQVKDRTGKVVAEYPASLPKKEAIAAHEKKLASEKAKKQASKDRAKENKPKNEKIKANLEKLESIKKQDSKLIERAHHNKNLNFHSLPLELFNAKDTVSVYQSRSYGGKKGSEYRLIMVDGKPAYAREADHWGNFSTSDFVNGEQVSEDHDWKLEGLGQTKWGNKERHAGYVFLDDLKNMTRHDSDEIHADSAEVVTEMDIAKKIRDGVLTSPLEYKNITIFALRITGTGVAFREKLDEYVHRPPEYYLSDEFLERCSGLLVIWKHPKDDKLDSDSFAQRVIGTICLPYIKGDEVWGIAKIYDAEAAQIMSENQLSTSPAVMFEPGTNKTMQLKDGKHVLFEGEPNLLDHLAIDALGVWDKGGKPTGVLLDETGMSRADSALTTGDGIMAEKDGEVVKSGEEKILAMLEKISTENQGIITRLEALEAEGEEEIEEIAEKDSVAAMLPAEPEKPALAAENNAAGATTATNPDPAIVADNAIQEGNRRKQEEERRADKARLDAVEKELQARKDADARHEDPEQRNKMLEAQARADAVEQCYGDSARAPLRGETVREYELSMAKKHQKRSAKWMPVELTTLAEPAFAIAREEIYADSAKSANSCEGLTEGVMIPIKTTENGCTTIKFRGKRSFTDQFTQQAM